MTQIRLSPRTGKAKKITEQYGTIFDLVSDNNRDLVLRSVTHPEYTLTIRKYDDPNFNRAYHYD